MCFANLAKIIEVSEKSRSLGQALWQSRTQAPVSRVERSFVALDPKNDLVIFQRVQF